MRRSISAVASMMVAILAVSGCGSVGAARAPLEASASNSSAGTGQVDEEQVDAAVVPETLNELRPYGPELNSLLHATEQRLIAGCMTERGFNYQEVPWTAEDPDAVDTNGVVVATVEEAREVGLVPRPQAAVALSEAAQANDQLTRTDSNFALALDSDDPKELGCSQRTGRTLEARLGLRARAKYQTFANGILAAFDASDGSDSVKSAASLMIACLNKIGVTEEALSSAVAKRLANRGAPSDAEIAMAVARAECDVEAGYSGARIEARRAAIRSWAESHAMELEELGRLRMAEGDAIRAYAVELGVR